MCREIVTSEHLLACRKASMQSQASREEQLCRPTSPNPLAPHKRRVELSDGSVTSKQQQQQSIMSNKENRKESEQKLCFECNLSLANSTHLINVAGRTNWWHPECFRCNICNISLDKETTCHVYKDRVVCRADYAKLQRDLSVKCSRCHWPIGASDWVRRAGEFVYHLACFSCDICQRQLSTGEQFTIRTQEEKSAVRLLCRLHFTLPQQHNPAPINSQMHQVGGLRGGAWQLGVGSSRQSAHKSIADEQALFEGAQSATSGDYLQLLACSMAGDNVATNNLWPINSALSSDPIALDGPLTPGSDSSPPARPASALAHKHLHLSASPNCEGTSSTASGSSPHNNTSGSGGNLIPGTSSASKSKRVRTTFTEEQLSILQNQFQIDSNPDGQDLERIATITGLSKRVTQVWFQNSRARQKKYLIKRKPSAVSSTGSPTITSGGQTQAGSSQMQPFDSQIFLASHQVSETWTGRRDENAFIQDKTEPDKWSMLDCGSSLQLAEGRLANMGPRLERVESPDLADHDQQSTDLENSHDVEDASVDAPEQDD